MTNRIAAFGTFTVQIIGMGSPVVFASVKTEREACKWWAVALSFGLTPSGVGPNGCLWYPGRKWQRV